MVKKGKSEVKKEDNSLYWIMGVALFLILVLVLTPTINKKINTINYEGLTFTKEKFGEVPVYHYYYYFKSKDGLDHQYNLFLRLDPRKNKVPVTGEIKYFHTSKFVYLSADEFSLPRCDNTIREISTLSLFISGNEFNIKWASTNASVAKNNNLTFVNCTNKPDNMVILIEGGNKTEIRRSGNCYQMIISDCEGFLEAIEKFEVQSIIDGKKRSESQMPSANVISGPIITVNNKS